MIETGIVLNKVGEMIFLHMPPSRTAVSLPDSYILWEVLWTNKHNISGFAHNHPGEGYPAPSSTDLTTFAAIEAGLGMRLDWWIASEDRVTLIQWNGEQYDGQRIWTNAFRWVKELRRASQIERSDPWMHV
jgi:hypothetical protein